MPPRDPSAGLFTMARRALGRRCPRCGGSEVFERWGELREACPHCGLGFEREQGYWVGAMIINTTATFALFLLVLVGGLVLFWPEVPWEGLLVATFAVALLVPILFYPRSKTLWLAIEMSYHPLEPSEIAAARRRMAGT